MLFETKDDGEMCFDFTYYFIFVFAFLINYFFVSENTYILIVSNFCLRVLCHRIENKWNVLTSIDLYFFTIRHNSL